MELYRPGMLGSDCGQISDELKRTFLRKIADSTTLAKSEQLRELIAWLGQKALEGAEPTEYDVAIEPLQRPRSFDPQTDSLVRKEMSRLRAKLQSYYATEGRGDIVHVSALSAYRLTFHWAASNGHAAKPGVRCLLILPLQASAPRQELIDSLYEHLLFHLGQADAVQLIAPTTARLYAARAGDVRTFAQETGADFIIEGSARVKDGSVLVTLWLVDGITGRTRRPCKLSGSDPENVGARAAECVLRLLDDQGSEAEMVSRVDVR